jgi:hypothetical protein
MKIHNFNTVKNIVTKLYSFSAIVVGSKESSLLAVAFSF